MLPSHPGVRRGAASLYRLPTDAWAQVNEHALFVSQRDLGGLYTYQFMGTPGNVSLGFQFGPIAGWTELFQRCSEWRDRTFSQIVAEARAIKALAEGLHAFADAMLYKLGHHEPVTPDDLAQLAAYKAQAGARVKVCTAMEPSLILFSNAINVACRDPQVQALQVSFAALFNGLLDLGPSLTVAADTAESIVGEWEALALELSGSYEALAAVERLDTIADAAHLEIAAGEWGSAHEAVSMFLGGAAQQVDTILGCGNYIYDGNELGEGRSYAITAVLPGGQRWALTAGSSPRAPVTWQIANRGNAAQRWTFHRIAQGLGYWNITHAGSGSTLGLDCHGNRAPLFVDTPDQHPGQWWRLYGAASSGMIVSNMLNGAPSCVTFEGGGSRVRFERCVPSNPRQVLEVIASIP